MRKTNSRNVVLYATLAALIFVAMTMDRALTPFLPLSAAFITLTVTFSFALMRPRLSLAVAATTIFGVSSCITAIFFGKTAVINPLISILPRVLLGFIIFGAYKLMHLILCKTRMSERVKEITSLSVASLLTTLSNTVLFLSALVLFGENTAIADVFKITVLVNAIPELVITAILVPVIVLSVRKSMHYEISPAPKATDAQKKEDA